MIYCISLNTNKDITHRLTAVLQSFHSLSYTCYTMMLESCQHYKKETKTVNFNFTKDQKQTIEGLTMSLFCGH